jgi:hypothetical protein
MLDEAGLRPLSIDGTPPVLLRLFLNNAGQILANYVSSNVTSAHWLTLEGRATYAGAPAAGDQNDQDHYIGLIQGKAVSGYTLPFLDRSGIQSPIHSLGVERSQPTGLNNQDEIVGRFALTISNNPGSTRYAPFYWKDGISYAIDVSASGWQIDEVQDINDSGVILAHGVLPNTGEKGVVLLRPIN